MTGLKDLSEFKALTSLPCTCLVIFSAIVTMIGRMRVVAISGSSFKEGNLLRASFRLDSGKDEEFKIRERVCGRLREVVNWE